MQLNLRSKTYGLIRFSPVIPAALNKWVIPGSRPYSARGKFGSILLQQITTGNIHLLYSICDIREDLALDFIINKPVWGTHIALENANILEIGRSAIHLKQGQFNMIHSPLCKGALFMEQANKYRTLSIAYPFEKLKRLAPVFPFLKDFINKENVAAPEFLFKQHRWISSTVSDMVSHLLNCLYRGNLRKYYFHLMIKDLLFSLLSVEYIETVDGRRLNPPAAAAINETKYLLETNYRKPVSLREIAKQVDMNVKELENELNRWLETG